MFSLRSFFGLINTGIHGDENLVDEKFYNQADLFSLLLVVDNKFIN